MYNSILNENRTVKKKLPEYLTIKSDEIDLNFKYAIDSGLGFFPYGTGLLNDKKDELPKNGILILGKDFGSIDYFEKIKKQGEEHKPTLRNLLSVIDDQHKDNFF